MTPASNQLPPLLTDDDRANFFANLIIDRVLDDKKNGVLMFTKKQSNLDIFQDNKVKLDGKSNGR